MSVCDATCKPCIYSSTLSNMTICCDYLLITHNRRGCDAGKGCERRIVGEKAPSIESLIYRGQDHPKLSEEERQRKKEYQHEWYMAHREQYRQKSADQYDRKLEATGKKRGRPNGEQKSWSDLKRQTQEKTRAICQGRQKKAINDFMQKNGYTNVKLADMVGVKESTLRKWRREYNMADWTKLAQVGIRRPEGL